MFLVKLGGIDLPYPPNIKIEGNPKLFAIYAIPESKIETIQVFCIFSNAERITFSLKSAF